MQKIFRQIAAVTAITAAALFAHVAAAGTASYMTLVPNQGQQVLLSELVSGAVPGIIVGDKMFDTFNYSFTGDMPAADRVAVIGITDADGNYGISFQGAFIDLVDANGPQIPSDAGIRFDVAVTADAVERGYRIHDAHLFGSGTGNFDLAGQGAFIAVDENFVGNDPMINDGMTVFASNSGAGGRQLEDWIFFDQVYTRLKVQKDIVALSSEDGVLPARMTIIDQTFSQIVIPEPASWMLFSIAMTGLAIAVRRRES